MKPRLRWLPAAVWAALILVGTSLPPRALPQGPENSDKVAHLILYAVLAVLLLNAMKEIGCQREHARAQLALSVLKAFSICALFGAFDEWHQQYVQRTTSLADWIADVVGAIAGALAFVAYLRRGGTRRKRNGPGAADQW